MIPSQLPTTSLRESPSSLLSTLFSLPFLHLLASPLPSDGYNTGANLPPSYQLAAINPGTINPTCTNLLPGQTLCLGTESEDCSSTYVVKPGNTCADIYKAGAVNGTIFNLNNPQVNDDCTNIYVGQVVCVLNEVRVPPAPGVPIHTLPPASATLANPAATAKPAGTTKVPEAVITPAPAPTPAPAAAVRPISFLLPDGIGLTMIMMIR